VVELTGLVVDLDTLVAHPAVVVNQVEEQVVRATLVVVIPAPLPLLQQARLALLTAKLPPSTASTPRTSKALG